MIGERPEDPPAGRTSRLAVIGAGGRTGRIVVERALAAGHEVIATDALLEALSRPDLYRHAPSVAN